MNDIWVTIIVLTWSANVYFAITGLIRYAYKYNEWVSLRDEYPHIGWIDALSLIAVVAPLGKILWDTIWK